MVQNSFVTVLIMLIYAVPGYLLVKSELVKKESISAFAVLLTYVCQPCLTVYAFDGVRLTGAFALKMLVFFVMMLAVLTLMLAGAYLILKGRQSQVRYRILTISAGFGNFTFMGIPVVQALLPDSPEAKVYATVAFLAMSLFSWTVGSAVITRDKKYCRIDKIFINPGSISFAVALIMTGFSVVLPETLSSAVVLVGKMATPLCMIVMGMRLATMKAVSLFQKPLVYAAVAVKQLLMPLCGMLILLFLPIGHEMKMTFYIMCCMPVASNVLNFAEMLGDGQEDAANTVLLSTMSSVATMPVMMLLAPLI